MILILTSKMMMTLILNLKILNESKIMLSIKETKGARPLLFTRKIYSEEIL